ncbi:MAG: FIST C-terminal domain-containing protein [Spirochaetaceae bacterium]|jgi:hypothetical protein|nr:FIST C-terminal domain-containing protein [Spirochaetaceae bacterium]
MIRFLTAFTFEIDDPRIAAQEILEQLDTKHALLKNSAGLLFCSLGFVSSGVAEAVCKELPFEVIGCTTHGIAAPETIGENILAVTVLTSNDSFFKIGVSEPLNADGKTRITELYERLSGSSEFSPALILVCHSNPEGFPGDNVVEILDRASGGIPLFGTNALDETFENRTPLIIHNGSSYADRLALLLVYDGTMESRFDIKSLPALNIYSKPALATEVQGNKLISINNIPAVEFMEKLGIISKNKANAVYGFPLLVDNNDDAGPKSCAIHSIEDGGVLRCGSTIVQGATVKLVSQMRDEVLRNSEQLIESIKEAGSKTNHLIFSCFGRSIPLVDLEEEMALFKKHMEGRSYMFIYSGGEFCPVHDKQGKIRNCFHQFSIISLSF